MHDVVLEDATDEPSRIFELAECITPDFESDQGHGREATGEAVLLRAEASKHTRLRSGDVPTLGGDRTAVEPSLGNEGSACETELDENTCSAVLEDAPVNGLRNDNRRAGRRPSRRLHSRGLDAGE